MNVFTETQRFRQGWVWAIMAAIVVVTFILSTITDLWRTPIGWANILVIALVVWLVYAWQLDTRYDSEGIHYRVFPLIGWRTIRWADIAESSVTKYGFVGYGIRWNFGEWVYNVAGNEGLRIKTTNGKRILLGTQRPDELRAFLTTRPTLGKTQ